MTDPKSRMQRVDRATDILSFAKNLNKYATSGIMVLTEKCNGVLAAGCASLLDMRFDINAHADKLPIRSQNDQPTIYLMVSPSNPTQLEIASLAESLEMQPLGSIILIQASNGEEIGEWLEDVQLDFAISQTV